jgi:Helix-turn-helix domain
VPGYGIITRLGARIYDLRERNYEIKTERGERDTVYRLIAAPKPEQLSIV